MMPVGMPRSGKSERQGRPVAMMPVGKTPLGRSELQVEDACHAKPRSWAELEAVKSRLAVNMDRVEYLATAQKRLTDMRANQARELGQCMRSRSSPNVRMQQALSQSVGGASNIFEDQQAAMKNSHTSWKRLDAVGKYVIDQETQKGGPALGAAAKRASRGTRPPDKRYPLYQDLYNLRTESNVENKDQPMMAVYCSTPYIPPLSALRHGRTSGGTKTDLKAVTV
eukprot:TRINITY_DN5253_c0_g1_i1.p1 TRINITY_DN5253_c0_g1~~TRINITY_DN5253_c0_g1_i1.p1  ORF type:complete len:246 (+),score=36.61 TRINITY_DN5253_c0_g1_i1:65-739(+)